jgi:uncharacterized protein (DUF934 family)
MMTEKTSGSVLLRVIKDNQVLEDDWIWLPSIEKNGVLPQGNIIVPLKYWQENRDALTSRDGKLAVCINGEDSLHELVQHLQDFPLIALEFPAFKDGRCYSHARLLRDRYHYQGDLRAVGDVLRDQLFYMKRCGFSSFCVRDDKDIQDALNGLKDFSITYQTAADGNIPIDKRRAAE